MRPDVPPPQLVSIAPSPAPSSPAAEGTVASPPDGWYRPPRPPAQLLPTMLELPEVAVMTMPGPPPIEARRKAAEGPPDGRIAISSDVVCAIPLAVTAVSDTHFRLRFNREGFNNYFLFKVTGAAGKLVRFDFEQTEITRRERKWVTLNPVYSYVTDLDDPASFVSEPPADPLPPTLAWNGPFLPDTRGQKWHYVPDVWEEDGHLCWVMRLEEDHAYVAMRPPLTPGLNDRLMAELEHEPLAKVITVGKSRDGQPLRVVVIGEGDPTKVPCILIYAREHANEQDAGWVIWESIRWMTDPSQEAARIRHEVTHLVIPMLDPDGASRGSYSGITDTFAAFKETTEAAAYANFFKHWIDQHRSLDVVLNLHNVESNEAPHVSCWLIEPSGARRRASLALHGHIVRAVSALEYRGDPGVRMQSYFSYRLGGWLLGYYGPLHLLYEVNSQAPTRHLSLAETRRLAPAIVGATVRYVETEFHGVRDSVTAVRIARDARWRQINDNMQEDSNAIVSEYRRLLLSGPTLAELPDPNMLQ